MKENYIYPAKIKYVDGKCQLRFIDFPNIVLIERSTLEEAIVEAQENLALEIIDYDRKHVMVQCVKTESANNDIIKLFNEIFINRIEVVRGGSVAIEAISSQDR